MRKFFQGGDTQNGGSKIKGGSDPSPNFVGMERTSFILVDFIMSFILMIFLHQAIIQVLQPVIGQ